MVKRSEAQGVTLALNQQYEDWFHDALVKGLVSASSDKDMQCAWEASRAPTPVADSRAMPSDEAVFHEMERRNPSWNTFGDGERRKHAIRYALDCARALLATVKPVSNSGASEAVVYNSCSAYVPHWVEFGMKPCSPMLTQCPRCKNPHGQCDGGVNKESND